MKDNIKILSVEENISCNPFAYIRTSEDIDILLTNLTSSFSDQEKVTKPVLQLLSVIATYILNECDICDMQLSSFEKLLLTGFPTDGSEQKTTLDFLISSSNFSKIKEDYKIFKENFWSPQSTRYLQTLETCLEVVRTADVISCLKNLKGKNDNLQAVVKTADGHTFEFWFYESSGPNTAVEPGNDDSAGPIARVSSVYPFLYHFDGSAPLNVDFLTFIIKKFTEAKTKTSEQTRPAVSEKVADKFKYQAAEDSKPRDYFFSSSNPKARMAVANHEAAHAAMYYLFGVRTLTCVDIAATQKSAGRIWIEGEIDGLSPYEETVFKVVRDYAGYVNENAALTYTSGDVHFATRTVKKWVEQTTPAFDYGLIDFEELGVSKNIWIAHECLSLCQDIYNLTEDIVQRNAGLINALAFELVKRGEMSGEDVFEFLRKLDPDCEGSELRRIRLDHCAGSEGSDRSGLQ